MHVKTNSTTGPLGYDNSIFVDDDGKPYMLIKNGQKTNRIQAIGKDGQLTDTVINLDLRKIVNTFAATNNKDDCHHKFGRNL